MDCEQLIVCLCTFASVCLTPAIAKSQDTAEQRLASIISVATSEYKLAVDDRGALISTEEYAEAVGLFAGARDFANRLTTAHARSLRSALDALIHATATRQPPATVETLRTRLLVTLGSEGAVELPGVPPDTVAGRQLFSESCASCHGSRGLGDGPATRGLSTAPPAIGRAVATPRLSPALAYDVISVGIHGTAMPAFGTLLTPKQRWDVVNYVYTLRDQPMSLPGLGRASSNRSVNSATPIIALLDSARALSSHGDVTAAGDRAFDAYLQFEPLEIAVRAKDPALVATIERQFGAFRVAVRRGNESDATMARNQIAVGLPRAVSVATGIGETSATLFWQSFIIILREGFEAILVVGAIVAFLIKTGNREQLRSIWIGVALGVAASAVTAVIIKTAFAAIPVSGEIVEAVSLLTAVVVLFSVSYWLMSKVEAARWQQFIKRKVSTALERGGGGALMLVAFLAVYREGAETALFYQALFSQAGGSAPPLIAGILTGSVVLAAIFLVFYRFGVRIPLRPFFAITSLLLYYMAFVFAGRGIRELQEGNVVPMTPLPHVPGIAWLGLFPTIETVAIQSVLLALFVFALVRTFLFPARRTTNV